MGPARNVYIVPYASYTTLAGKGLTYDRPLLNCADPITLAQHISAYFIFLNYSTLGLTRKFIPPAWYKGEAGG